MHTGRGYSWWEVVRWTRFETAAFVLIGAVPTALYMLAGWKWLAVPWLPIALIGTAVAFITGFKNNASYSRLWEARTIWGGIVNSSRFWATQVLDLIAVAEGASESATATVKAHQESLIRRHLAWLTGLRYQLRESRSWENTPSHYDGKFRGTILVAEWDGRLDDELQARLSPADWKAVLDKSSCTAQLMALQSRELAAVNRAGLLTDWQHIAMTQTLEKLIEEQGRCERIKNFPYPRQFWTLNRFFVWLFICLMPFGLLEEFQAIDETFVWMAWPGSVIVAWVFHTMDKIGDSTKNPFEGGPNDVPVTALSRSIEIDLLQMLGASDVPPPLEPQRQILM